MPPQQYTMMQDLAFVFGVVLAAAEAWSCKNAGRERPQRLTPVARQLRRVSFCTNREMWALPNMSSISAVAAVDCKTIWLQADCLQVEEFGRFGPSRSEGTTLGDYLRSSLWSI